MKANDTINALTKLGIEALSLLEDRLKVPVYRIDDPVKLGDTVKFRRKNVVIDHRVDVRVVNLALLTATMDRLAQEMNEYSHGLLMVDIPFPFMQMVHVTVQSNNCILLAARALNVDMMQIEDNLIFTYGTL